MHLTPNVYCPLCGVILLRDPYSDDDPASLQSHVRPWYAEVRGLYLANGYITTTGLGIVEGTFSMRHLIATNLTSTLGLGCWRNGGFSDHL